MTKKTWDSFWTRHHLGSNKVALADEAASAAALLSVALTEGCRDTTHNVSCELIHGAKATACVQESKLIQMSRIL